jgi:hypothetical protein
MQGNGKRSKILEEDERVEGVERICAENIFGKIKTKNVLNLTKIYLQRKVAHEKKHKLPYNGQTADNLI